MRTRSDPRPAASLRQLASNLWVADRGLKLLVGDIGARMTVIRLSSGDLFLHSPVTLDDATRTALDELGPVRHVVAPNKVHHFFVKEYQEVYVDATFYCAPGLEKKRRDLDFQVTLSDDAPAAWADDIEQHVFGGATYMNEVVFFHAASETLVLTDLAFNVAADSTAGARAFYWLTGAAGRFGPHRGARALIRDRRAARRSVERILRWPFDRIVVAHGEVLESGGRESLREAFAYL